MLLGRKSYAIAMRKLGYREMIALGLGDCSIFPYLNYVLKLIIITP